MEWISVDERLPAAGEHVLFCTQDGGPYVLYGYKASNDPDDGQWMDAATADSYGDLFAVCLVTHWMPLPEPPPGLRSCYEPATSADDPA
jgi:hypothetical protein